MLRTPLFVAQHATLVAAQHTTLFVVQHTALFVAQNTMLFDAQRTTLFALQPSPPPRARALARACGRAVVVSSQASWAS